MKRALRILVGFIALIAVATAALLLSFLGSRPKWTGEAKAPGLASRVEVTRDVDGVPHIFAATQQDALYGLGYVHAQDRLWQMEFQRRAVQGRLAEALGEPALELDRYVRTLGLHEHAKASYGALPAPTKALVDAYVAGVNGFIDTHGKGGLSPEFTLLWLTPERWTGADAVGTLKLLAWDLNSTYELELLRADMVAAVGPERMAQLMPPYPSTGETIVPDGVGGGARAEPAPAAAPKPTPGAPTGMLDAYRRIRRVLGREPDTRRSVGSNNWVVSGERSASGKPMLANDPHVEAAMPSLFYVAHLSGGGFDAIGATVPGLPCVLIGRNQRIAWGVTNVDPDVQDLFEEKPEAKLDVRRETIKVRWGTDVEHLVRRSAHGPLLTDALNPDEAAREIAPKSPRPPLALKWTALADDDRSIQALIALNLATDWTSFQAALSELVAPAQNFVYADVDGNIGYLLAGRIPVRSGPASNVPRPGWTGEGEWTGFIPASELPRAFNPPQHRLVTANHKPAGDSYPHYLGADWELPMRAHRIGQLLDASPKLSREQLQAIQADTHSNVADALLPTLLARVQPRDAKAKDAVARVTAWDRNASGDSAGAAIFEAWYQQLVGAVAADELGAKPLDDYDGVFQEVAQFLPAALAAQDGPWCDDVRTPSKEDCNATVTSALERAVAALEAKLGGDMAKWRWDGAHWAAFSHHPFDQIPLLDGAFSRSVPNGGDWSTVNLASFRMVKSFRGRVVAGYRQVLDLSGPDEGSFILAGGQSGHVMSDRYDDLLADWSKVRYRPLRLSRAAVQRNALGTLSLLP